MCLTVMLILCQDDMKPQTQFLLLAPLLCSGLLVKLLRYSGVYLCQTF
jgi:hypothetical protein